ncbi:hypothetical protein D3C72_2236760 [compost metagenome]
MLTALRATSSTAAVISLTAAAACSISRPCNCRLLLVWLLTALSSSEELATRSTEAAMCLTMPLRLCCISCMLSITLPSALA